MKSQTIIYTLYALFFIISAYKAYKTLKQIKNLKRDLSILESNKEFYKDLLIEKSLQNLFKSIMNKEQLDLLSVVTNNLVLSQDKLQTLPKQDLNNLLKHFTETEEYEKAEIIKKEIKRREK